MGYQTDPMEPPIPAPTPQPAPQKNPALYRAKMLQQFLAANPSRRAPPMGRNPDGSIAYDPSVYGSAGTMPDPRIPTPQASPAPPTSQLQPLGGFTPKQNPFSGDQMTALRQAIRPRRMGIP